MNKIRSNKKLEFSCQPGSPGILVLEGTQRTCSKHTADDYVNGALPKFATPFLTTQYLKSINKYGQQNRASISNPGSSRARTFKKR